MTNQALIDKEAFIQYRKVQLGYIMCVLYHVGYCEYFTWVAVT